MPQVHDFQFGDSADGVQEAFEQAWSIIEAYDFETARLVLAYEGRQAGQIISGSHLLGGNPRMTARLLREAADAIERDQVGFEVPNRPLTLPDPEFEPVKVVGCSVCGFPTVRNDRGLCANCGA